LSVVAPPEPPRPDELEALIREARARQRRRRLAVAGFVALAAGLALALWAAIPGGGSARSARGGGGHSGGPPTTGANGRRAQIFNLGSTGGVTWAMNARHFWLTGNGGGTWRPLPAALGYSGAIHQIQYVDRNHGWVWSGARNRLYRTADGGRSWESAPLPRHIAQSETSFTFVSRERGYLAASAPGPRLFATQDGGATWHLVSRPPFRYGAWGLDFVNRLHGFAVANNTLYRTTNGGRRWSAVLRSREQSTELWSPTTFGSHVVVPELVFATGNPDGPDRLVVHSSRDGGVTWSAHRAPQLIGGALDHDEGPSTLGFTALTPSDWVAQSSSGSLVTTDGGRSWRTVRPTGLPNGAYLFGTSFTPLRDGWALLARQHSSRPVLMRTTDGGRHWSPAGPRLPEHHRR
jgi:photosystem II stability/assembly factor-like uncharacterized protein